MYMYYRHDRAITCVLITVNRASGQFNHVAAVGLCCSVYVCLSALASSNPVILPPAAVSDKELHRDTERVVTELRLYIFQFCS